MLFLSELLRSAHSMLLSAGTAESILALGTTSGNNMKLSLLYLDTLFSFAV